MPKGLVVHLDDDLYRRFAMMCAYEGMTLKDQVYKMIKEDVECFEWFFKEEGKSEGKA
jgi:hypothetical protein